MDMAFGLDGHLYVRDRNKVARFDVSELPKTAKSWREKPFRFGRKTKVGRWLGSQVNSAVVTPCASAASAGVQGLAISPRGHIVLPVQFHTDRRDQPKGKYFGQAKKYELPVFPGRYGATVVHTVDNDGKLLCDDAFKGSPWLAGVKMDRDGYVYAQMSGITLFNGKVPPMPNRVSCTLVKFKPGEAKLFWEKGYRKPIPKNQLPKRPRDFGNSRGGRGDWYGWLEGTEWLVPEMGISGNKTSPTFAGCVCSNEGRFDMDLYARSFCSEPHLYRIAVVDANGNAILRIGRMGNVDDGKPLAKNDRVPNPRAIGGDEVAIAHCRHVAVHSDKRLFISDIGNTCVRSVKLDYRVSETVPLQ
jgi:hypothetical protein